MVNLIGATTTRSGLRVRSEIDTRSYPQGVQVTDEQMQRINLSRHEFHGDWNYTIVPELPDTEFASIALNLTTPSERAQGIVRQTAVSNTRSPPTRSTRTVEPSATSPAISLRASGFCTRLVSVRLSGRAPNWGSNPRSAR